MNLTKKHGFTVVELAVVIVVIAILATITTIAYRETQKNARDEKRKVDAAILISAVEDYYADNGSYPKAPATCSSENTGWGIGTLCLQNEIWNMLKQAGYLQKIPETGHSDSLRDKYAWFLGQDGNGYAIYIPLEGGSSGCKVGKSMQPGWFWGHKECDF